MNKSKACAKIMAKGDLDLHYSPESGQILRIYDRNLDMDVISFAPGNELEINGLPLSVNFVSEDDLPKRPAWQCMLRSCAHHAVGCAQGFDIFRQVVVGSASAPTGNHINPPQSLHIRYRFDRARINSYEKGPSDPESAGQTPIQMPQWLDTIGALCARSDWFGPETRMIQSSIGGAGPRSHVSHEEGTIEEVVPHLWNHYRTSHPGVQTIPGAIYTHPDGRWLWITCQRPQVGMHWDFEKNRLVARFQYHDRLEPAEIIHTPEVSLYWGRGGRKEMLARLNENFIGYEEPGDWYYHTTWFWLHWWQFRERGYKDMIEHVKFLNGELGLTGFGITSHDLRPGCMDCSPTSMRPSPHIGGDAGLRKLGETVRSLGGKMYAWMPFLGLSQPGTDLRPSWSIRGEDGRPYESFSIGSYDMYHGVNYNHPEVQAYYLDWIRRYIQDYKIEGIFWDCGGTTLPPDFSSRETRPFQRWPSECMVSGYSFMEKVMQTGKACSPDFFMWHETFSQDLPGTGYSSSTGSDAFLMELNRHGRKRLVFQSHSKYNLYGGFARVYPFSDTAFTSPVNIDTYRPMAKDPMNRWLVDFVRRHGTREAQGIVPGVSYCANHIVVDPGKDPWTISVPSWVGRPRKLTNVLTGKIVSPDGEDDDGIHYSLDGAAAYALD